MSNIDSLNEIQSIKNCKPEQKLLEKNKMPNQKIESLISRLKAAKMKNLDMSNYFKFDKRRNVYPLIITTQIDFVDSDEIAELEKLLLIPKDSIGISAVPKHIMKRHGMKLLFAYEDFPWHDCFEEVAEVSKPIIEQDGLKAPFADKDVPAQDANE